MGVDAARKWCGTAGISLRQAPAPGQPDTSKLSFTEEMKGFVGPGTDFDAGFRAGGQAQEDLMFHLTISIDRVFDFVENMGQTATAEGWVSSRRFGEELPVEQGWFNLFVDQANPTDKRMLYRLFFSDRDGQRLTLSGFKVVHGDPGFDVWHDTTTLFTRVLAGHVNEEQEASAPVVASGILRLHLRDFLKQVTTFNAQAPTDRERIAALTRFGTFFLGNLWDVYGRHVLEYGPW